MRFAHTNLVARDWRRLAAFYETVFGCTRGPERRLAGAWLERGTGVAGARIEGIHLRLPGFRPDGPTLEIFQYQPPAAGDAPLHPDSHGPGDVRPPTSNLPGPNRPGFGHIAFQVDDVQAARERVIAAGGSTVGSIETIALPDARSLTWCYVRDPEGNIVELQHTTTA